MWKAALKLSAATVVFAGVHSLLATRASKRLAARLLGERRRNAVYRPFYLAQSLVTFAALGLYARSLPDRVLYDVGGPARTVMQLTRALALLYAVHSARQVGLERMLGVTSMRAYLSGSHYVPPEPEAQGPAISAHGEMKVTGPFAFSRHPLNFAPLPIFLLKPRMTVRLAAFTAVSAAYFLLGSMHEEARLHAEYGDAYRAYQLGGIPFYLPVGRRAVSSDFPQAQVDARRLGPDPTESVA